MTGYEITEAYMGEAKWVGPHVKATPAQWYDMWTKGTQPEDMQGGLGELVTADSLQAAAFRYHATCERVAFKQSQWRLWLNARIAQGKIKLPQAHMPYYGEPHGST